MTSLFSSLDRLFPLLIGAAVLWIALVVGASIVYRTMKGKQLLHRRPGQALFFELGVSGRSSRNLLTSFGAARNALAVTVTADRLIVQPMFPFTMMFLPEIFGLEYDVPKRDVHLVSDSNFGTEKAVTLMLRTADGNKHTVDLRLRNKGQFLTALKSA